MATRTVYTLVPRDGYASVPGHMLTRAFTTCFLGRATVDHRMAIAVALKATPDLPIPLRLNRTVSPIVIKDKAASQA